MTTEGGVDHLIVSHDVPTVMRDGTVLCADVYRPNTTEQLPVLLCRTPYDKSHERYRRVGSALARSGYMAVVQDIRGLHSSSGEWFWHMTQTGADVESRDGYDTCEWAASLPGADGQVGTWGNSYPSWCIWRMAAAQPPSLKAIFTSGFSVSSRDTTFGIFEPGIRLPWHLRQALTARHRTADLNFPSTVEEIGKYLYETERSKWLWRLPLVDLPDIFMGPAGADLRQYWREIAYEHWGLDAVHPAVSVPTCTLTGWWDRLSGAADHFAGMVTNGPAAIKEKHRLIIGPWVHDVEAIRHVVDLGGYQPTEQDTYLYHITRWYDFHLKGIANGVSDELPVKLFLMNENQWHYSASWPPKTRPSPLYLDSNGSAATVHGDGRLTPELPAESGADAYTYDPRDPVMSLYEGQLNRIDLSPNDSRSDILMYVTSPLEDDLVIVGRPLAEIWFVSDRVDTDVVVRLVEIRPDGLCVNLSHGVMRLRYRNGYDREDPLTPGEATPITVKMLSVGVRLLKGSRLRVEVTSSDFPAVDRNHNTGRPFHLDDELLVAHQQVLHSAEHPSRIVLPVLQAG